ncbi:hypothetical protein CBS147333_9007 [Penicillium roqueforti]|nr:hypothetical protein CBS147333_9007 [Penicillium roqueforti]KAI3192192.1 hypothetical protein CBS147311_9353 [Penicillium roqueforti]KAI3263411.1 hypothetical protein CBS147308_8709 [Penicillium roqueforti]KAI3281471.1 hypothetical protein DTO003C3_8923 [Penicillium roqueforti]
MSSQDEPPARRRESRSGSRKVSTLSAEQLERKRANDREAQRSIRQRTKEHIEHLESQIEEMRLRTERFDEVVQHNAFLENEVIRLKHQIAALTGRPEFASSNEPMASFRRALPPPHFTATSHTQPSSLLVPRRASPQHDWQQPYPPTRSPSLGAASNPEFPNPTIRILFLRIHLQRSVTFHVECQSRSSAHFRPSLPTLHISVPATNASIATDGSDIRVSMGASIVNNACASNRGCSRILIRWKHNALRVQAIWSPVMSQSNTP